MSHIERIRIYGYREWMRRVRSEYAPSWLARHLPHRIRYYTLINEGVRAIRDDEIVPEVAFMDVLERSREGLE